MQRLGHVKVISINVGEAHHAQLRSASVVSMSPKRIPCEAEAKICFPWLGLKRNGREYKNKNGRLNRLQTKKSCNERDGARFPFGHTVEGPADDVPHKATFGWTRFQPSLTPGAPTKSTAFVPQGVEPDSARPFKHSDRRPRCILELKELTQNDCDT